METRTLLTTITVTSAADTIAEDGVVTLREAIIAANTNTAGNDAPAGDAGLDTIAFNIPGAGVHTIVLSYGGGSASAGLPAITEPAIIDGYTQPGASQNTNPITAGSNAVLLIQIDASIVGSTPLAALSLAGSGGSTVRGLNISNAAVGTAIAIRENSAGNTIAGNYIGTDAAGASAASNNTGIHIAGPNNTIGGTTAGDRNVISGNNIGIFTYQQLGHAAVSGNRIVGNFIGTNAAGTAAVPNRTSGIEMGVAADTTVGGTTTAERNVISGNTPGSGLSGSPVRPVVQGNYIGVDVSGIAALGNGTGFDWSETDHATIGGTAAGAGNVIGGNGQGIDLGPATLGSTGALIQGNFIGTDSSGTVDLGNSAFGIYTYGSHSTTIGGTVAGAANLIAFSHISGIYTDATNGNSILGNSIYRNFGSGIENGAVGPTLTSVTATTIAGTLAGAASTTYRLEFFATPDTGGSSNRQGKLFLGFQDVSTDAAGHATFTFSPSGGVPAGQFITATSTSPNGTTSIFSTSIKAPITATAADMGVAVSDSPDPVAAGSNITYTITATNAGPDAATDVALATAVPIGATFVSLSAPNDWTTTTPAPGATGGITATIAGLATNTGAPAVFTLVVRVNPAIAAGSILNLTAMIDSTLDDPNPGNNTDSASTTVAGAPPVNIAPTAVPDAYEVQGGQVLNVPALGVLTNDTDPENDPLTAIPASPPSHGTLTLNADGSFTYAPNHGFIGDDIFTYRANDGQLDSAPATVTITVTAPPPVNTPPTAEPDAFQVQGGQVLNVPPSGVLANDTDPENDPLTAVLATSPSHGTLTLNADGSFTYAPNHGFVGDDIFTYRANDGQLDSAPATVTITVTAPRDTDGPILVGLRRFGYHAQPTLLVLNFNEALAPETATNLAAYRLVTAGHDRRFGTRDDQALVLTSATYDPAAHTVTLATRRPAPLRLLYQLTVSGGPNGLTDLAGNALDGDANGTPGGDAVIDFDRHALAGPSMGSPETRHRRLVVLDLAQGEQPTRQIGKIHPRRKPARL